MGILAHIQRAGNSLLAAPLHHCLGNGQNMVFIEATVQGRAPVTGGAETHPLGRHFRVGLLVVISGKNAGDISHCWKISFKRVFATKSTKTHGRLKGLKRPSQNAQIPRTPHRVPGGEARRSQKPANTLACFHNRVNVLADETPQPALSPSAYQWYLSA